MKGPPSEFELRERVLTRAQAFFRATDFDQRCRELAGVLGAIVEYAGDQKHVDPLVAEDAKRDLNGENPAVLDELLLILRKADKRCMVTEGAADTLRRIVKERDELVDLATRVASEVAS